MNIDSKIKQELENESDEIDKILSEENEGLISMLQTSIKGGMKRWFIFINIITIIITIGLVYCGYQFFTQPLDSQIYWGVLTILCLQLQIGTKQWIYNEMGRSSVIREVKRVELALAELASKKSH